MFSVLENIVDEDLALDESLLNYWEDLIGSDLITPDLLSFNEVTPQLLWKWRMNIRGLMYSEFRIPYEFIYPNIRVNGLTNYDLQDDKVKDITGFYLIDSKFLESKYEEYLIKYKK